MSFAQASGGQIKRNVQKQNTTSAKNVTKSVGYGYTGKENGHEYVDLGLSVKWATCNVGAKTPSGWGDYYAWGETQIKSDYSWATYFDSKDSSGKVFYTYFGGANGTGLKTISPASGDDIARKKWGGKWRLPNKDELAELLIRCIWEEYVYSKKRGYKITGPNGKFIFLPFSGSYDGKSNNGQNYFGSYWSSTLSETFTSNTIGLWLSKNSSFHSFDRYLGCSIRPVFD